MLSTVVLSTPGVCVCVCVWRQFSLWLSKPNVFYKLAECTVQCSVSRGKLCDELAATEPRGAEN